MAIYFGAKHGHNFNQVLAKLFHLGFIGRVLEDGDFHTVVLTDLEDDFTTKAEQTVFVGQNQFFDFSLQKQKQ